MHHLFTEHHGKELVVGDVLDEGGNNVARLLRPIKYIVCVIFQSISDLEECLIVPVRVNFSQLGGDSVMFSHEESVDHGQHSLLVNSGVAGQEAVNILALNQDHSKGILK